MPSREDAFREVNAAMMGDRQSIADTIDNDRNGCFEFCDGWPSEQFETRRLAVLDTLANISNSSTDEVDQAEVDVAVKLAADFAEVCAVIETVCRRECPGAYSLFDEADELYDTEDKPIVRECPVKTKLAEAVIQLGSIQSRIVN